MVGMAQQDLITGFYNADATKTKKNEVTGCFITQACFDPHQKIDPVYFWNNVWLWNGGGNGLKIANYHPNLIREGVHYFDERGPKPGYTEYVYPHPLASGTAPIPPDPTPIPPQPPTNLAPTITITKPVPDQVVITQDFTIEALVGDDPVNGVPSCVAWVYVFVNGKPLGDPSQCVNSVSRKFKIVPYRDKGPITVKIRAEDIEGLVTEKSVTFTAKKP
jgi:hypothetical protein